MSFSLQNSRIDNLSLPYKIPVTIDVLRLDLVHAIVSGNKYFKLKEYLREAKELGKKTLLSFGGAYSNHIVATATAARLQGFKSVGIIRGEEPAALSHSLQAAREAGMQLYFTSRGDYKNKVLPGEIKAMDPSQFYIIPEGGYGEKGADGAKAILDEQNTSAYKHIFTAVGTGTTLAGLVKAALPHQTLLGIPVLKNALSLQKEITDLLPPGKHNSFQLLHDYHFGGYAKQSSQLFGFMNDLYQRTRIPTDFVYTARAFYAVLDLLKKDFFTTNDKILIIHTGGLQGNLSLPKGTLIFP